MQEDQKEEDEEEEQESEIRSECSLSCFRFYVFLNCYVFGVCFLILSLPLSLSRR